MKVFVISLKSSIERRNYTSQVLDRQSITFEFFDAEDINRDSEHFIFKLYNEKKSKRFKGYALTKPELGCFASHISLWRKCIDLNENILIMEDNFELSGNLKHQIANINQLTSDYGLVKIGNSIKEIM
ncbi:glycosyltransferase family 25 protein [Vibrio taketomensis]|uniref:glycosyltransferase family 25 protein n=1 Tax=Vibrio taketomensis TaxID=2572923 RepID=UPI001E29A9FF|nr:glycosyltransferase family 25 protein [Vibrio taketomensis]